MIEKRIICFLGPQGSGKGTQAELLSKELSLPHVSTGSLYRLHIKQETSIGLEAKDYIESGRLAPDSLTNQLIEETLGESTYASGIILDGYPRTVLQKEFLDKTIGSYTVIYVELSKDDVLKRIFGRLQCSEGHIYHTEFNPPKDDGVCDVDQLPLNKRKDDTEESLLQRLKIFEVKTRPLLDAYKKDGNMHVIDGKQSIEAVFDSIKKVLI